VAKLVINTRNEEEFYFFVKKQLKLKKRTYNNSQIEN